MGGVNFDRSSTYGFIYRNSQEAVCENCKHRSHVAASCTSLPICDNCALSGHTSLECKNRPLCLRCREPGHIAQFCPFDSVCAICNNRGHGSFICELGGRYNGRPCTKCYRPGHAAHQCRNYPVCPNCRRLGHFNLGYPCIYPHVCNLCNLPGHSELWCRKRGYFATQANSACQVCGGRGHMNCEHDWFVRCIHCGSSEHTTNRCHHWLPYD